VGHHSLAFLPTIDAAVAEFLALVITPAVLVSVDGLATTGAQASSRNHRSGVFNGFLDLGGASEEVAPINSTEHIIPASPVPGVTERRLDGHPEQLPLVSDALLGIEEGRGVFVVNKRIRVVRIGFVAAVDTSVGLTLIEARLHDEEALARLTQLTAPIPMPLRSVALLECVDRFDIVVEAARAFGPRMAFLKVSGLLLRMIVVVNRMEFGVLVKALKVALVDRRGF